MKRTSIRKTLLLVGMAATYLLTGCFNFGKNSSSSEQQQESVVHTHQMEDLIKYARREPTCIKEGRLARWYCEDCGEYFLDAYATKKVAEEDTIIEKLPHTLTKTEEVTPTCIKSGKSEYWTCSDCNRIYADENATTRIEENQLTLSKVAHSLEHVEAVPSVGKENGVKEHWDCLACGNHFSDENGKKKIALEDTIDYALMNIPDFVVSVPTGKDPVVLQLTDTQIIDGSQIRPGRDGVSATFYAKSNIQAYCYDYVTEVVEATNPDLIILTGDNIYGEFDDNGSVWLDFVAFMDSFEIPWAPIFGNHDNESKMGVDWQCEQLEKAEYCLFEQKELTGNGNYSVAIEQGGELKRVFYMLDTNGCGHASEETLANGHSTTATGFQEDQIAWYTKQIEILKEYSPETKLSFAYHIQQEAFADAYARYGFKLGEDAQDINVDLIVDKAEGDFGYIGRDLKGEWDKNYEVYEGFKQLGVDSVFVGHEHCNSASVVYEGIRFQFGQKSSMYDRFNRLTENGTVVGKDGEIQPGETALIGGSVIVLAETDGAIQDAYIYYCGMPDGKLDWTQFAK